MKNSVRTEITEIREDKTSAVTPLLSMTVAGSLIVALFEIKDLVPAWAFMWALALALYFTCKWLVLRTASTAGASRRSILIFFVYPGMDGWSFFRPPRAALSRASLFPAFLKAFCGAILIWGCVRLFGEFPALQAWLGMAGIILMLHFGLFELIALYLQSKGYNAPVMMDRPIRSASLAEFWSKRWNRDFHLLARHFIFKPLHNWGGRTALMAGFVISGIVHELVITIPANGGYGGPSAYFLVQGLGILLEKELKKLGLVRSKFVGWLYTLGFTLLPVGWLFPLEFRERVILPFLQAIGAL